MHTETFEEPSVALAVAPAISTRREQSGQACLLAITRESCVVAGLRVACSFQSSDSPYLQQEHVVLTCAKHAIYGARALANACLYEVAFAAAFLFQKLARGATCIHVASALTAGSLKRRNNAVDQVGARLRNLESYTFPSGRAYRPFSKTKIPNLKLSRPADKQHVEPSSTITRRNVRIRGKPTTT